MDTTPPPAAPLPDLTAAATDTYGGYRLAKVREAGGDETVRFEATLTHRGRPIAIVANGGTGGGHDWAPLGDSWDDVRAFWNYAVAWNAGTELAGIEDSDQLINRLLTVAALSRSRRTPFLIDEMDCWATGQYATFPASVPRARVLEALRSEVYRDRRPRVWDRDVGDFVPVLPA